MPPRKSNLPLAAIRQLAERVEQAEATRRANPRRCPACEAWSDRWRVIETGAAGVIERETLPETCGQCGHTPPVIRVLYVDVPIGETLPEFLGWRDGEDDPGPPSAA